MTDLERLDEALEKLDRTGSAYGNVELLADAARAYRNLLANGERVDAWNIDDPGGWWVGVDGPGEYVVVPIGLLVDPPKEEE